MNELPFRTLLYRYLFIGWLFRTAATGDDMFERAAIHRYNREQARWLPVYLLRWLWLGLACHALGQLTELVIEAPVLINVFYAASYASLPVAGAIVATWLGFRRPLRQL